MADFGDNPPVALKSRDSTTLKNYLKKTMLLYNTVNGHESWHPVLR